MRITGECGGELTKPQQLFFAGQQRKKSKQNSFEGGATPQQRKINPYLPSKIFCQGVSKIQYEFIGRVAGPSHRLAFGFLGFRFGGILESGICYINVILINASLESSPGIGKGRFIDPGLTVFLCQPPGQHGPLLH